MMESITVVYILIAATLVVLSGAVFYWLGKRGYNVGAAIKMAGTVAGTVDTAWDALSPLLPRHTAVTVIDGLIELAKHAVAGAEQLYKTHQIKGDARKATAKEFIVDMLSAAGVEITPEVLTALEGAVEGAVALLPKTHDNEGNILK